MISYNTPETTLLRHIIFTATTLTNIRIVTSQRLLFEGPAHEAYTAAWAYLAEQVVNIKVVDNVLVVKIVDVVY